MPKLWEQGEQVEGDTDMEKLPGAIDLDAIHEREKSARLGHQRSLRRVDT